MHIIEQFGDRLAAVGISQRLGKPWQTLNKPLLTARTLNLLLLPFG